MAKGYVYTTEEDLQDIAFFDKLVDFFGELKQVKGLEKIQKEEGLVVFQVNHFRIKNDGDLYRIEIKDREVKKLHKVSVGMNALKVKLRKIEGEQGYI